MDDYTVNIYLSAPYAGFLFGVASRLGGICSKAYYDEVGDAGYLDAPVGTGPYRFVEARSGERIVLEANEDYWRGAPAIQRVTIQIVPDVSTQLIGLERTERILLLRSQTLTFALPYLGILKKKRTALF